MTENKEPFTNDNEEIPKLGKEKESKNTKICIITLLVIFVSSIIISIILTQTIKSDEEESNKDNNSAIIKAKYQSNKEN